MKRIICFILILLFVVPLSFSSFSSIPSGNVTLHWELWEYFTYNNTDYPFLLYNTGDSSKPIPSVPDNSGMLYGVAALPVFSSAPDLNSMIRPTYQKSTINIYINGLDGTATFWLAVFDGYVNFYDFLDFTQYRYPDGDMTEDLTSVQIPLYNCFLDNSTVSSGGSDSVDGVSIRYACFRDVPVTSAATAALSYRCNIPPANDTYLTTNSNYRFRVALPVMNYNFPRSVLDVVDDFKAGDLPFSEAIDEVQSITSSNIDSSSSVEEKNFHSNLGTYILNQLVIQSGNKSLSDVFTASQTFDDYYDQFMANGGSLSTFITVGSNYYTSLLAKANTPEEAQLSFAVYSQYLQKLQLAAEQKATEKLDAVISDAELKEASDYYKSEDDLVDKFDVAQFSALLKYETWLASMPADEVARYRQFFDHFLSDSPFSLYLTVPMTMVLVCLIFGTGFQLVTHRRNGGGDDSA